MPRGPPERIAAAPELCDNAAELRIHLGGPAPARPERIWRHEQSALLRMNSMAEDVTVFTHESSTRGLSGAVGQDVNPLSRRRRYRGASPPRRSGGQRRNRRAIGTRVDV
ncbi:FAD/NAD(P)-binding protein [Streptomyces sp. NBC_01352]|uniref:FAD/NAD(P)-binding protein n=1 Tax=Streptomyces sp. NBC_01352 TaxID=2903834 RepID=UPI002E324B42|nr:FAD/NAD(P)-binding protein [Streptomyces sp. NBC_01352]